MHRVVFQFDGNKYYPRRWWVFFGLKVAFNPCVAYGYERRNGGPARRTESTTICAVFIDGKKVAKGVNSDGGWLVNNRWCADRLYIDAQPYTLEGRSLPANFDDNKDSSPCIFCGKLVRHINGGGAAWAGSTRQGENVVHFLYCNAVCGDKKRFQEIHDAVWTCVHDSIDLVGDTCWICNKKRSEADRNLPEFLEYR